MKQYLVIALGFLLVPQANAQPAVLIATYLFDAPSPGGTRAPTYVNPLVLSDAGDFYNPTGSTGLLPISTPPGYYAIGPTGGNNRALIARNWLPALTATKYFGDTLRPIVGNTLVVDSVIMWALSSPQGPLNAQARTNLTGYTNTVGTILVNNTSLPWKKWKIIPVGVMSPTLIDFRFYAYAGIIADANTTWRIDSVKFYGHLLNVFNLPVSLLSFTGMARERDVELSWSTATETNNDYFTIEKSYDMEMWEVVGTEPGAGTSLSRNDYSMRDQHPMPGWNYYRLSQTDLDGTHVIVATTEVLWRSRDGPTQVYSLDGRLIEDWSLEHRTLPRGQIYIFRDESGRAMKQFTP